MNFATVHEAEVCQGIQQVLGRFAVSRKHTLVIGMKSKTCVPKRLTVKRRANRERLI
jgi:hypothetical protein